MNIAYYIDVGSGMLALYTKYTCMYCFDPQTRRIVVCGYMHPHYSVYCVLAACPGSQCA